MARSIEIFQVDTFTTERFCGNPAGVVLGCDALSDEEMQLIARELNNGDSAMVGAARGADHDIAIRFFTPRTEAGFVGHATLAAHAVLHSREPRAVRRQLGKTGIVEVAAEDNGARFSIGLPTATLGNIVTGAEADEVLALLGLARGALDGDCALQIAGGTSTRLLIGVEDAAVLGTLAPQFQPLAQLSARIGAQGYFVFARRGAPQGCLTESRMFCPALGINEDPASGNAHGMLGVYLATHGLLPGQSQRFTGAQGAHMGRSSRLDVTVLGDARTGITGTRVGGAAVTVFQARMEL